MKRISPSVICLLAFGFISSHAQVPAADPVAQAAQRDAEERYKRMAADLESISQTQEMLQRHLEELRQRVEKLDSDVRSLKEDQSRSSGNLVTRDELRKTLEKLAKEIDDRREADKKLILDSIKKLGDSPAMAAVPEAKPTPRRSTESGEEVLYPVQAKDTLLDIIAAYNIDFKRRGLGKITMEDVLHANPDLKPDHLRKGQKIRIPVPGKEKDKDAKDSR
jgi:hypothetical protein